MPPTTSLVQRPPSLPKKLTGEEEKDVDMPQVINDLKERFQQADNAKLEESGKDRLVIFIDDLDRLHPRKAVELLEILKLFLDCDRCVFVLAIDYEVVSQGVKQKYGELIGEEKGRSFFDKIIQVPFKMPVAQYDIQNYVMRTMGEVGVQIEEKEINTYVRLIQASVGCNPRAMKRLFILFYSMWSGYKQKCDVAVFLDYMRSKGATAIDLHTSGHADANTIDALVADVKPKDIIPVHTENAGWFDRYENCRVIHVGEIEL